MEVIFQPGIPFNGNIFLQELLRGESMYGMERPFAHRFCRLEDVGDNDRIVWNVNGGGVLVHTHFRAENTVIDSRFQPVARVESWIGRAAVTVVPIRDPGRAMLTAHVCGYKWGVHKDFVDLYGILIRWTSKYKIIFLPIDLLAAESPAVRKFHLIRLFEALGTPQPPLLNQFAQEWPVFNHRKDRATTEYCKVSTGPMQDIRDSYPGDPAKVSATIPAYEYLRTKKKEWRSFFKGLGYRKLPWWK